MAQSSSANEFKAYSFNNIQVYSSTEWLADNKKQYKQVFEQSQLKYIYVDLTLINKLYDRENWDIKVELKCFNISKGKIETCSLNINKEIDKKDHIIHIREGWGHKKRGTFWKRGKYVWEVYIDNNRVASKYFYVEDLSTSSIIYPELAVKVENISFYESGVDNIDLTSLRKYCTTFDIKTTRYVFFEVLLDNRIKNIDWQAEFTIKYYNEASDLKGVINRIEHIKKDQYKIEINGGWGSNVIGSWRKGKYSVCIIFQDKVIASGSFLIGNTTSEGNNVVEYPQNIKELEKSFSSKTAQRDNALGELHELIGLKNIKRRIHEHTKYLKFVELRRSKGLEKEKHITLHSIFSGNPGTGKTTVARLMGNIYHDIGLLSKGHVHEVSRVDLIGEYIGQTAPKVKEAIEKARGGVLFIDEAYSLARTNEDNKDFGREAIEILIKEMSNINCDFMVIAAGYPVEMKKFVDSNPGLSSRFKYSYHFNDYNLEELFAIKDLVSSNMNLKFTPQASKAIDEIIYEAYRNKKNNFGNARFVHSLIEKSKIQLGIRLMSKRSNNLSIEELMTLKLQDILPLQKYSSIHGVKNRIIDKKGLADALDELNQLTGLEDVKKRIQELTFIFKDSDSVRLDSVTHGLHSIFIGNPGTGKTTVARIISKVYKALGLLSKGHLVETDRQGLVAGYIGQTENKTKELINQAKGGVLFIDEAYSLSKGGSKDFGQEAIQILLKNMEDLRHDLCVIVAGYPKEMSDFLNMNPGLKSRFDYTYIFEDFDLDQLMKIALNYINQMNYRISKDAKVSLRAIFKELRSEKTASFGNARTVRKILQEIIHTQNLRRSEQNKKSKISQKLIKDIDIKTSNFSIKLDYQFKRNPIGF